MAYQYDDEGKPLVLSPFEKQYKELWKNVAALDLPELNPAMIVDKPSFDPAVFLQKISWAHAEIAVLMDVIDSIIVQKTLRVQPVSTHQRPFRDEALGNTEGISLAKEIFIHARDGFKSDASEIGQLNRLADIRRAGWPLIKSETGWYLDYSFETLINLPTNGNIFMKLNSVLELPSEMFSLDLSSELYGSMMAASIFSADDLPMKALLSSLDLALLKRLSIDHERTSPTSFELDNPIGKITVQLSDYKDESSMSPHRALAQLAARLYRSFIASRGKTVNF